MHEILDGEPKNELTTDAVNVSRGNRRDLVLSFRQESSLRGMGAAPSGGGGGRGIFKKILAFAQIKQRFRRRVDGDEQVFRDQARWRTLQAFVA